MEFSRIGEHTIKCVISEEEIYDLGYTMDEIMSNGERTQEFMNQMCGTIATSMSSLLNEPTDIGFPLINSSYQKTFDIPDELCNGTDIVKVTFRLTVGDLIDSDLLQLYPISIVKQIIKQEV